MERERYGESEETRKNAAYGAEVSCNKVQVTKMEVREMRNFLAHKLTIQSLVSRGSRACKPGQP